jgi:phage gpG-like protein
MSLTITLSPKAQALLAAAPQWPTAIKQGIRKALNYELGLAVGYIQRKKLSQRGPTTLGVRTNRLRSSVWQQPAAIAGDVIVAAIGSNVRYAGVHEFGGTFTRTSKAGSVRLKADSSGNVQKRGNLATFAKRGAKNVKTVSFAGGKSYSVTVPARAPFRTGLQERSPNISRALSNAVVTALSA